MVNLLELKIKIKPACYEIEKSINKYFYRPMLRKGNYAENQTLAY